MSALPGLKPVTKAPEKSNFSHTCNLLSQYLKENNPSFGDLGFGNTSIPDSEKSPAMDLFPLHSGFRMHFISMEEEVGKNNFSETKPANKEAKKQMTMIYGGKVLVFDDISAEMVKELVMLASNAGLENKTSLILNSVPAHVSHLPHARKASLHRFLEKRKDRNNVKAPYQVNIAAADQSKTWLALSSPTARACSQIYQKLYC